MNLLLLVLGFLQSTAAHSCYYFVNDVVKCSHGHSDPDIAKCIACADKAKAQEPKGANCTDKLISDACRGILPNEPASAGQMNLTLLHAAAAEKGAVCLDGTAPGYYWREGTGLNKSKFLLVFQGGGWCRGVGKAGATAACADRATGTLGSSTHWSKTLREDAHGMTNTNCQINPAFCSWSVAYMYYCDGASFSGDLAAPVATAGGKLPNPIYFRGAHSLTLQPFVFGHEIDRVTLTEITLLCFCCVCIQAAASWTPFSLTC